MKMSCRENLSYLVPRDPSIRCWGDRVKLPAPCTKNLIQLGAEDFEETMGDNIKVYLRLKPSLSADNPFTVLNSTTLQTEAPKESVSYKNVANGVGKLNQIFTFTSILDQDTTQAELFEKCTVKNLKKFLSGENYLLMAYGTTSAGKTYTMQGNVEHPGVIPRAVDFMFTALRGNIIPMCRYTPYQYNEFAVLSEEQFKKDLMYKNFILSLDLRKFQRYPDMTQMMFQTNSSSGFSDSYVNVTFKEMQTNLRESESVEMIFTHQYSVWISMIEIYNEQVYDLLDIPNEKGLRPKLALKDDERGNTFVKNLRYVNVCSGHEAFQIFQFGRSNLHLAPTALNPRSSRSHCIFTITLAKFLDYDSSQAIISRFSFCDLAGMERAKKTLNVKERLVESKAINTSLSILVKCLTTIKENQNSREKRMIPYRESKLTKLFRDAVLGKEQFSLIVNVTTEPNLFDETLNVLKFSAIPQKIIPRNEFVRPTITKVIKKSRFSRIVSDSKCDGNIDWDASTEAEVKEELKDLVEALREQLAQEKKRCEKIEEEIRDELTSKFSEMLKTQNENNRIRMEDESEKIHEMYERKHRRLVHYYEILRKKERLKPGDDLSDSQDREDKLKELEKEAEVLRTENESLKEQLQELLVQNHRVTSECSELKFKLVEKDKALEARQKTNRDSEAGKDAFEKELRKELNEAKAKISEFKSLLDEAASDYKELEENNNYWRNENETLEQHLMEHLETANELRDENSELQKMLSEKTILVEKLEKENEKFREELYANRPGEEKKLEEMEAGTDQKEVEILREQLRKTSELLNQSRDECEGLRGEKLDLEKDLEIAKLKIADLQEKLLALEENTGKEAELERGLEEGMERAKEFESKAAALAKENEILEEKCKELEEEVKSLQKEVKDLIGASRKESEKLEALTKNKESLKEELLSLKKRNSELEEELKRLSDDWKTAERESQTALENLRFKLKTLKYQNSIMKNLKDEAERQAYEVPRLHEEIKNLEREIENREKELTSFNENRIIIFNNYEKELKKVKEENERLRKDVLFANEVIAKTMTPLKTDKAEISRLRESVMKKEDEINKLKAEVESFKKPDAESIKKQEAESVKKWEVDSMKKLESYTRPEESSSPPASVKKKTKEGEEEGGGRGRVKRGETSCEGLAKREENPSVKKTRSTRKKVDLIEETIHPSTIKSTKKGRKKKEAGKNEKVTGVGKSIEEEKENIQAKQKKGKCYRKLFTNNDFDELTDLNGSPLEET